MFIFRVFTSFFFNIYVRYRIFSLSLSLSLFSSLPPSCLPCLETSVKQNQTTYIYPIYMHISLVTSTSSTVSFTFSIYPYAYDIIVRTPFILFSLPLFTIIFLTSKRTYTIKFYSLKTFVALALRDREDVLYSHHILPVTPYS